jgi:3-hydroxyacyl-[acyl-carrier-protein] dehydratase
MKRFSKVQIYKHLPHSSPMDFLQDIEIDPLKGNGEALCIWQDDHVVLDGHFPGFKVVPGVLLIEAGAQAAGFIYMKSDLFDDKPEGLGVLSGVSRCAFSKPVYPNDKCVLSVSIKESKLIGIVAKVSGSVLGEKVFDAQILLSIVAKTARVVV